MDSTKLANSKAFDATKAERADRSERGESDFNIVIELDESQMAQVAGGIKIWIKY
jgi:hypothetical protein